MENGVIVEINNYSGHYQPPPAFFHQVVAHLRNHGVQVPERAQAVMQEPGTRMRAYPTATGGWATAERMEDYDSERPQRSVWKDGAVLDIS